MSLELADAKDMENGHGDGKRSASGPRLAVRGALGCTSFKMMTMLFQLSLSNH